MSPGVRDYITGLSGRGQPLSEQARLYFEPRFGENFDDVRVHTDAAAIQSARELRARAYTTGADVVFDAGEYDPHSSRGRHLLAHELSHVVQQTRAGTVTASASGRALEAEAGRAADDVTAGRPGIIEGAAAAGAPQAVTTDQGDTLPDPILVDWSERFQITFGARTTGYGDVKIQYKFKYLGSFAGDPEDLNFTIERDPGGVMRSGVPHTRRLNARITSTSSESITVDVYGDGTVIHYLWHTISWSAQHKYEIHQLELLENNEHAGTRNLLSINTQGVALRPEAGTLGTVAPPPTFKPDPDRTPQLPTGVLLDMIMGRLGELPLGLRLWMLRLKLAEDMKTTTEAGDDEGVARNARRLLDLLTYLGPIFTTLDQLSVPEQYLGDLAPVAIEEVNRITDLYIDAMLEAYVPPGDTPSLTEADKGLAAFPDWVKFLYLRDDRGVKSLIEQIPGLLSDLRAAREQNGNRWANAAMREADDLVTLNWGDLHGELDRRRESVEFDWRDEKDSVLDSIQALYNKVQYSIALITAMTWHEQLSAIWSELSSSTINSAMEATFWGERTDRASQYVTQLQMIVFRLTGLKVVYGSGYNLSDQSEQQIIADALKELADLGESEQFQSDLDDFATRIKWVDRIAFVGKLAVIIAAAALTGGSAGSLAFAGLRAAGAGVGLATAGELVIGGLVFTIVSREGQQIVFGKAEGNFFVDWFWNTATLGVLKAANFGFTKLFKLKLDPNVAKIRYTLGRTATAMVSLHGIAEMHHLASTGEFMSNDDRLNAVFQNVALMVGLEAGRFITAPLEARLTEALVTKLRIDVKMAARIDALAAERAPLVKKLEALSRGESTPADVEKLLHQIEGLWAKELALVNDGVSRKILTEGEMDTALAAYREHIGGMQLRLSQLGIEAPAPAGTLFRPVARGVVAFTPEGRATLEKYYTPDPADPATTGKSLKESTEMPGVLEGRLPNGELTYYLPEGSFPKGIANAQTIIAGRDAAVLAAKGDPVAAEGLRRLQEGLKASGANQKAFAQRNIDAILGSMTPETVVTFLRAMADPAFTQGLGVEFYTGLAGRPAAINFARAYGPAALVKMWRFYGWNEAMLVRAETALETAETPAARDEFLDKLVKGDRAAVDKLLDNVKEKAPREPAVSKKTLGVNRASAEWKALRNDVDVFVKGRPTVPAANVLDMLADLLQVHAKAMSNKFAKWKGNQDAIEHLLNRFDEIAFEIAQADPAGLSGPWAKTIMNWRNSMRGAIGEAVGRPEGVAKFEGAFLGGSLKPIGTPDATIPDYSQQVGGVVEWVNIKSDVLAPGLPGSRSGTYAEGVAAASKYRAKADKEAGNLPAGEKYSIQFLRDPLRAADAAAGKRTEKAMLDTLFNEGSPIFRVKFGSRQWISFDEYVKGSGR